MDHLGRFGFLLYLKYSGFGINLESLLHTASHQIAHQIEKMHTIDPKRIL